MKFTVISDDIFHVTSQIKFAFKMSLAVRSVGVRLNDSSVALFSPLKFDQKIKSQITEFGKVSTIIAPNLFHHLFAGHALDEFPGSKLYSAPGLGAKRRNLKIEQELSDLALPEWNGLISQTLVGGMPRYNEVVFVHHPSRTLIATDLIFHVLEMSNWRESVFWKLNRAYKRPAASRLFRLLAKDRRLVKKSIENILQWDFDRILMAHGEHIESHGKKVLEEAFTWLLKA